VSTAQSAGIAATPFGGDAIVAWPTANECYVERVMTSTTGTGSKQPFACNSPRLASDGVSETSLVYEAGGGVQLGTITMDQLAAATSTVAANATSPRAVFDGTLTWISYVDAAGEIEVGFLGANGLVSTTISGGLQPHANAYELAMIGGAVWVVGVDANGFAGYKLCADQVPN